jgi:mono/diheme cytochrome c family protein
MLSRQRLLRHGRRRLLLLAGLSLVALAATGCVTNRGSYPIEIFTEMHYAQTFRSQEPPRLQAVAGAEVFVPLSLDASLTVKGPDEMKADSAARYAADPRAAAELYRVNCSVCHGVSGQGDGPIAPYLTDPNNYTGAAYEAPPDLTASRTSLNEDALFAIMTSGIFVMPQFGLLLSEEDRWDVVQYVFDEAGGLGN